jgi:hypothetical protein
MPASRIPPICNWPAERSSPENFALPWPTTPLSGSAKYCRRRSADHRKPMVATVLLFDEIEDFRYADGRSPSFGHWRRLGQCTSLPARRALGRRTDLRGVSVSDASDHLEFFAKLRNISRRFSSISSADGAGPYFAHMPYPVSRRPDCVCSRAEPSEFSRTRLTYRSREMP